MPANGFQKRSWRAQEDGEGGRDPGVGVVLAQDAAAAGQGVFVQPLGRLVLAQLEQRGGEVAGGGQGVGVVLAEVAAAAGQGVFVELHLGPAVITSHPRIVAPAARACQAPAIDELFGV
jgi:hypothetical protein